MEKLWILSSPSFAGRGDRHRIRVNIEGFVAGDEEFQSVHFDSFSGANLYRWQTLSPNEMHDLRTNQRTVEDNRRRL